MRGRLRLVGTILALAGALALVWGVVVWQWQDPFTAIYTKWKQHELAKQYARRATAFHVRTAPGVSLAAFRRSLAAEGRRYRLQTRRGEAIGRIIVPRMSLNMIVVNGTDHASLTKGPGRDMRTFMPGENRLIYIAGHRTTYLAPFSHIDSCMSTRRSGPRSQSARPG
jgi:sortase A